MNNMLSTLMHAIFEMLKTGILWVLLCGWFTTLALAEGKHVVDAVEVTEFVAPITPLATSHKSKVLIDRYHQTIYSLPAEQQGTKAMLDILSRDGFNVSYLDTIIEEKKLSGEVLIIHGLPNEDVHVSEGISFSRSPLLREEVKDIVTWVAEGGGLFLTLSHFPGGSGAKPLLEAFNVQFRDGYLFSPSFPSFISKQNKCSHFFAMTAELGLLKPEHPVMQMGEDVNKVDFHCGAAVFRSPEDVILGFPTDSGNYDKQDRLLELSHQYAGIIGFEFAKGKVVIATDQGLFRNFLFTFNTDEKVHVTITGPNNDNAKLFTNIMRWLSNKIPPQLP